MLKRTKLHALDMNSFLYVNYISAELPKYATIHSPPQQHHQHCCTQIHGWENTNSWGRRQDRWLWGSRVSMLSCP